MIAVDQPAPAFEALDTEGVRVTDAELKGRWTVLYAYPKDDTPGCTVEACEFSAGLAAFAALDAQVFGVSPDSPDSHRRFVQKHRLRVRLLSDPDHRLLAAYGAWGEKVLYGKRSIGVIRSTVIVDPKGIVRHRWAKVKAAGHAEHVRARLLTLRGDAATGSPSAQAAPRAPKRAKSAPAAKAVTAAKAAKAVKAAAPVKKAAKRPRS